MFSSDAVRIEVDRPHLPGVSVERLGWDIPMRPNPCDIRIRLAYVGYVAIRDYFRAISIGCPMAKRGNRMGRLRYAQ